MPFDADFTKSEEPHNLHFGGGIFYYTYGNPINGTVTNNANGAFGFYRAVDAVRSTERQLLPAIESGRNARCSLQRRLCSQRSGWADFLLGLPGNGPRQLERLSV